MSRRDMSLERPKRLVEPRGKQLAPAEMVGALMLAIRNQFYQDAHAREWFRDSHFVKREVVLWPASWLNGLGLQMSPADYERRFLEKLKDVQRNCAQAKIDYFPRYLQKCIRDHFQWHKDEIYEVCKAQRVNALTAKIGELPPPPDAVPALVAARDVLLAGKVKKRPQAARPGTKQGELAL